MAEELYTDDASGRRGLLVSAKQTIERMLTTAAIELDNVCRGACWSPCKVVVDSSGSRAFPLVVSVRVARTAAVPVSADAFGVEGGEDKIE